MSRSINAPLRSYMAQNGGKHLTQIVKLGPLPDGTFRYLINQTKNLDYNPSISDPDDDTGDQTWIGRTGATLKQLVSTSDVSTDNSELQTLPPPSGFSMEGFTTQQVRDGVLDKTPFVVMVLNPLDTSLGHYIESSGDLGEVRIEGTALFNFELRSISDRFSQSIGEVHSTKCRAIHGSRAIGTGGGVVEQLYPCGFDASGTWVAGTVSATHPNDTNLVFYSDDLSGYSENYFAPGLVKFTSGSNTGITREIRSFTTDSSGEATVTLDFNFPYDISENDDFEIRRSCTKNPFGHNSCFTYFGSAWVLHFRGEPWQPVGDALSLMIPGAGTPSDLGGTGENPVLPTPPPVNPGGGGVSSGGTNPAPRTRGATVLDPEDFGADPTGVTDSTDAFNDAFDALPGDGGTVQPSTPNARFKINQVTAIQPVDNSALDLAYSNATLVGSYTATDHVEIIKIDGKENVEIFGGELEGFRSSWAPISGTTSEWGHGIGIFSNSHHITVRDCTIHGHVGDAVSIGHTCSDVVVNNCTMYDNRRQGVSNGGDDVQITNNEIYDIDGTSPKAGIDCEPDSPGAANNVTISGNYIHDCSGPAVLGYLRVTDYAIDDNILERCSLGVDWYDVDSSAITNNTIRHNRNHGIRLNNGSTGNSISGNYLFNNRTAARGEITSGSTSMVTGTSAATADHINIAAGSSATVGTNEVGPT